MAKKSAGASLRRLLDAAPQPIYAVDQQRRFAYCNPAFTAWTGTTLDDLADLRADYHSAPADHLLAQIAASLCPPPEAFAGRPVRAPVVIETMEGELSERTTRFVPLAETEPSPGVLALVDLEPPITQTSEASPQREHDHLHVELAAMRRRMHEAYAMDRLLGKSPAMLRVRRQIDIALLGQPNAVVCGPPGSGREHVARTIFYGGKPESSMLVPLSCELLDTELLDSTVNAVLRQAEELEGDTTPALLLLDVDLLDSACQESLSNWLVAGELSLRTIASARRPLEHLAREGEFREDLAMALSTLVLELPPLEERREDIPLLAQAFVEESNRLGGAQLGGFTSEAMDRLVEHPYSENVDELGKLVRTACANASGPLIGVDDLPAPIRWASDRDAHPRRQLEEIDLESFLREIEQELIRRAMEVSQGNRAQAAKLLGVSRAKLLRRLEDEGNQ